MLFTILKYDDTLYVTKKKQHASEKLYEDTLRTTGLFCIPINLFGRNSHIGLFKEIRFYMELFI